MLSVFIVLFYGIHHEELLGNSGGWWIQWNAEQKRAGLGEWDDCCPKGELLALFNKFFNKENNFLCVLILVNGWCIWKESYLS